MCESRRLAGGDFCTGCASFPCARLGSLDKRYRMKYGMSMIENLRSIEADGLASFVEREKSRWRCPGCGATICVHEPSCLVCKRKWHEDAAYQSPEPAAVGAVHDADWPNNDGPPIRRAIFVGGTATNVARLGRLDRAHLNEDLNTIGQMPADTVVEHFGVRPRRARQLAAGVAIVSALLDRFLLGAADVSEASLRDGAIIAALARGADWLTAVDDLTG